MSIYDLIAGRRTIRKFRQKEIPYSQIEKYINAARLAPSAANRQPLKYAAVVSGNGVKEVLKSVKWAAYLAPDYNPKKGEEPKAFIAVLADTEISPAGYDTDVGAAAENIILAALEDGIGACIMGAVDRKKISEFLGLSEKLKLVCVIALGYIGESPREVLMENNNVKYYLDGGTLCVPKRSMEEVLIKKV